MKMTINNLADIRKRGIEVLTKELGELGMTYFIRQYDSGEGDYTKDKEEAHKGVSIDDIVSQ